jgi:hypothetical protein
MRLTVQAFGTLLRSRSTHWYVVVESTVTTWPTEHAVLLLVAVRVRHL